MWSDRHNRGVKGEKGLGKSSSQCKGPVVRSAWPLSEHLMEGPCSLRAKYNEVICSMGEGAVGQSNGFEAGPRKEELFLVLVWEADLTSLLFLFPSDAHPDKCCR